MLNEWEHKVHECIDEKIRLLKMKHINKRKKHVLRTEKHLNSLQDLQHDYVLVPADKAPNNVIQWNPSNPDTLATEESVLISEVSLFQGL